MTRPVTPLFNQPQNLESAFLSQISQGIAVPDSVSASIEDQKLKQEWIKAKFSRKKLETVYAEFPVVKNYLEHHKNTRGLPMSLDRRPYLLDILLDDSPEIVIQKSVQCGITEIATCIAYLEAIQGYSILYVLPNQQPMRNHFVTDRVDKHFIRSPFYKSMIRQAKGQKGSDSKGLKHFGAGTLHFVGSNTEGEFSEFPADRLIVDEQDLCDAGNLDLAEDRLTESNYKRILRISNPRRPGARHSVGEAFKESDQKEWYVKCTKCGRHQPLVWEKNFIYKDDKGHWKLRDFKGRAKCKYCNRLFNRLGPGKWVAQNKGAPVSGYHISKLFIASTDILELYYKFIKALSGGPSALEIFFGSELGIYYISSVSRISLESLVACVDDDMEDWPEAQPEAVIVMGVDVGAVLHYKVSILTDKSERIAIDIGTVSTWGDLLSKTREHEPDMIVIDAQPETHKAEEFAFNCPYNVTLCRFGSREQLESVSLDWKRDPMLVNANRTAVFDATLAEIDNRMVTYPIPAQFVEGFFKQMQIPIRQLDVERGRYIWTKGEDHYRLADIYEWIAAQVHEMLEDGVD